MKIRGEPIEGLIRALDDPISEQWVTSARTLAEFGTKAGPAIPALCRALNSEKGWAAAYAIGFIHSAPEVAVPALIDALKRVNSMKAVLASGGSDDVARHNMQMAFSRPNIIWALGEFEFNAKSAIPILRQNLLDADPMVRQAVLMSLRKILPPQELKTLVPALIQSVNDPDPNLIVTARGMLLEIDPRAAMKAGVVE
jgi:HEAT repeat protein